MKKNEGFLFTAVFTAFFLTGAAGLIYQVVWSRMLHLVFGVTLYAAASVVVSFMAGLSAGSYFSGSIVRSPRSAASTYAAFEIAIGVFGFFSPQLLGALYDRAPGFYAAFVFGGENGPAWLFARFAACFAVLFLPTFLMGATLPILLKYLVANKMGEGESLGALYGINTLGACAGALLSGFVLIPSVGLTAAARMASLLNILAAIAVYWADGLFCRPSDQIPDQPTDQSSDRPAYGFPEKPGEGITIENVSSTEYARKNEISPACSSEITIDGSGPSTSETAEEPPDPKFRYALLVFVFVSGFVALGYEMVWTRIFTMFLKNAPYAFSVMLAVYLAGTGIGAAAYSWICRVAGEDSRKMILVTLNYLSPIAAYLGYSMLIDVYQKLDPSAGYTAMFQGYLWTAAAAGATAVLPVSLIMGATLPAAIETLILSSGRRNPGMSAATAGRLYSLNTVGAIAGTLAAGFFMIPLLGLNCSMMALLLAGFAAALALVAVAPLKNPFARPLFLWAGVFIAYLFINAPDVPLFIATDRMEKIFPGGKFVYYRDDEVANVGVEKNGMLFVDARPMTIRVSVLKMMAHIPFAIAENPKKMLVVCLGEGGTFRASSVHEELKVDVVELSPSVVEAYAKIYSAGAPLPRGSRIVTGDGRNFVHLSGEKYDIITIDPPPPLYGSGAVHFHTVEFYRSCRAILSDDGVICQWFPFQTDKKSYMAALKSFVEVFPECAVWSVPEDVGLLMLGTAKNKMELSARRFIKVFSNREVAKDLSEFTKATALKYIANPYYMLSLVVNDGAGISRLAADLKPVTDDSPSLEFSYAAYCSELEAAYARNASKYLKFTSDVSSAEQKIFKLCPDLSASLADCQDPISHFFAARIYAAAKMKPEALLEIEMARNYKLQPEFDLRAIEESITAQDSSETGTIK